MHTPYDDEGIPVSAGIPPAVKISAFIMIATIFVLLAMVFLDSHANHVWPAANSLTIPLTEKK
jgi:hypothetical protein